MGKAEILALINFRNKIYAINFFYAAKLGLQVQKFDVSAQKINNFFLEICNIVIIIFQIFDKFAYLEFFQETFLLADISMNGVFGMPILILRNADIQFIK